MSKILLIEDDEELANVVIDSLELASHVVEHVTDGLDGLDRLSHYHYDLAIIDRKLPNIDGLEICRQYRANNGVISILFLTGKDTVADKTAGLDSGADDYLTKPFAMPELISRVRALLRRSAPLTSDILQAGDFSLELATGIVRIGSAEITLLPKEMHLLSFLMRNPGRHFSATDLLEKVWKSDSESTEEAVKVCIMRLRKKIDQPDQPSRIVTAKGLGYKFDNK